MNVYNYFYILLFSLHIYLVTADPLLTYLLVKMFVTPVSVHGHYCLTSCVTLNIIKLEIKEPDLLFLIFSFCIIVLSHSVSLISKTKQYVKEFGNNIIIIIIVIITNSADCLTFFYCYAFFSYLIYKNDGSSRTTVPPVHRLLHCHRPGAERSVLELVSWSVALNHWEKVKLKFPTVVLH